jgi:hypothetical protein
LAALGALAALAALPLGAGGRSEDLGALGCHALTAFSIMRSVFLLRPFDLLFMLVLLSFPANQRRRVNTGSRLV